MRHLFAILALTIMLGFFAWRPVQAQPYALGPGFYDDFSLFITYSGSWATDDSDANFIEETYHLTGGGSDFELGVWGAGFTLFMLIGPMEGEINICVDSVCNTANLFNDSNVFQVPFEVTGLSYGVHDVEIFCTVSRCIFDGILIHPPAPQPTLPPQEIVVELTFIPVQPTIVVPQPQTDYRHLWTINDQVVAFDYQVSAGDMGLLLFIAVVALLVFIAMLIYLMRRRGDA